MESDDEEDYNQSYSSYFRGPVQTQPTYQSYGGRQNTNPTMNSAQDSSGGGSYYSNYQTQYSNPHSSSSRSYYHSQSGFDYVAREQDKYKKRQEKKRRHKSPPSYSGSKAPASMVEEPLAVTSTYDLIKDRIGVLDTSTPLWEQGYVESIFSLDEFTNAGKLGSGGTLEGGVIILKDKSGRENAVRVHELDFKLRSSSGSPAIITRKRDEVLQNLSGQSLGVSAKSCRILLYDQDKDKLWLTEFMPVSIGDLQNKADENFRNQNDELIQLQRMSAQRMLRINGISVDETGKPKNMLYKVIDENTMFKGQRLLDYSHFSYTFAIPNEDFSTVDYTTVYIPRPNHLIQIADYDGCTLYTSEMDYKREINRTSAAEAKQKESRKRKSEFALRADVNIIQSYPTVAPTGLGVRILNVHDETSFWNHLHNDEVDLSYNRPVYKTLMKNPN